MYARVSDLTGPTDRIDDGIAQYRDMVLPAVQHMDGFQRAYLLVDRELGRTLSITVWDSEAAMRASEDLVTPLRNQITETISAKAEVSRYEVVVATA
ncbi:MAG TPA: hypothetical protein VMI11_06585 [Actinomycetes bacterium]|nr:hypothetical protein [Actinomycetes bacterium]